MTTRVEINPTILSGKPVIRGTRIPVEIIVRQLGEAASIEEILSDYPRLKEDDVRAALSYAADSLGTDETLHLSEGD